MAKRILVVEDTRSIREIIVHLLRDRGYEVDSCADGKEAEARVASFAPDLLVLDAMLPQKSGFDLCAELKGNERTRGIRVLILTAAAGGGDGGRSFWKERSQADDFMTKPFKGAELAERVARLLGNAG
ncbi:MAG: response regulator transcription factor [Planctomycetota bacterium]